MPREKSKAPYHHGDLKNTLIDVALAHIARSGVSSLSLREVAREAGVSHSAAYRHFANKEDLLVGIAEQGFRWLGETLTMAARGHPDNPVGAFQAAGVAYVEFAVSHPEHMQIMFGGSIAEMNDYPSLIAATDETYGALSHMVAQASKSGQLRSGDDKMIALTCWATVHGLSQLIAGGQVGLEAGDASPCNLALAATKLVLQGINAPADADKPRRAKAKRAR
jgi:AcrR family transcriptional regulator